MGKIMMNGKQYGVGGITDASDVKYTSSQTVKGALDEVKADLTYKAGDSVSIAGAKILGRITMSGTDAYVSVILPKPISANSVSVTMTSANVFGATASTDASSTTVSNVGMNKQLGQVSFSFPISRSFTGGTVCVAEIIGTITFS